MVMQAKHEGAFYPMPLVVAALDALHDVARNKEQLEQRIREFGCNRTAGVNRRRVFAPDIWSSRLPAEEFLFPTWSANAGPDSAAPAATTHAGCRNLAKRPGLRAIEELVNASRSGTSCRDLRGAGRTVFGGRAEGHFAVKYQDLRAMSEFAVDEFFDGAHPFNTPPSPQRFESIAELAGRFRMMVSQTRITSRDCGAGGVDIQTL